MVKLNCKMCNWCKMVQLINFWTCKMVQDAICKVRDAMLFTDGKCLRCKGCNIRCKRCKKCKVQNLKEAHIPFVYFAFFASPAPYESYDFLICKQHCIYVYARRTLRNKIFSPENPGGKYCKIQGVHGEGGIIQYFK